jgi:MFS family permease
VRLLTATRSYLTSVRQTLPRVYWLVWWGTLINRMGGFVVPLLALYLTGERHLPVATAGAVVSMFGAGQALASLAGGVLADRAGRRITMLIGLFGGAVMMVGLAFAATPMQLMVLVGLLGAVGELYRPAVAALVADVVPPEHRAMAYGMLHWAINLGFSLAAVLGGFLAQRDFFPLFLLDAATMAAFGALVAWKIAETRPQTSTAHQGLGGVAATAAATSAPAAGRGPFADSSFMILAAIAFVYVLIPHQSGVVLSVHLARQGFTPSAYGALMGLNGVLIVCLQPAISAWSSRLDPVRVVAVAMLIAGCGMALHGVSDALAVHAMAVAVWTGGEILEAPTRAALVAAMAPTHARGRYQGVIALCWGAGAFVAPRLGTRVWAWSSSALWWGAVAAGGVAAAAALLAGPSWRRRVRASSAATSG